MLSEYRHRRRVQFYETDLAGIVHFSWYFRYMEEAEHAMWRTGGLSVAPHGSEIGWARVSATCDFLRPLRFEDEFEVRIRVAEVTRKTIRYACDITRGETRIAEGAMTVICVRVRPGETIEAIDMPPEIAARLRVASMDVPGGTA
ncbi:MAG: acyl-CoA thioesterase [Vicinamibacteraceae bacterium]